MVGDRNVVREINQRIASIFFALSISKVDQKRKSLLMME